MEDTVNIEKTTFKSKADFERAINKYISKINKTDEFVLFAHQINNFRQSVGERNPQIKLNSILTKGLNAYKYGSADGTLNYMGLSTESCTIDNILNYDYHKFGVGQINNFPTIVLAFPRFIKYVGKQVEFATSHYSTEKPGSHQKLVALLTKRISQYHTVDTQYTPKTWLDIMKGFADFAIKDTLFAFYQQAENEYVLLLPHTHWVEQSADKYAIHKHNLAKMVESFKGNLEDAIVYETKQNQLIVDSYLNDYD